MSETEIFRLNSAVLAGRIEDIKRNPPEKILAYKAAHPEFKTVACELLAAYAGLSVSTLKNLKLGKITDCNCSTMWLLCRAFEIDPADLLGLPRGKVCNPATCSNHSREAMEAKHKHIADLSQSLGAAHARADGLQLALNEKNAAIEKLDSGIKARNTSIFVLVAVIIALALLSVII